MRPAAATPARLGRQSFSRHPPGGNSPGRPTGRPAGQPGTAQGNGARSGSTQPVRAAGLASVAGW